MRLGLIGVVLLCGVSCLVRAQPQRPDTLWTYTYSSPLNDVAWEMAATSDGGVAVAVESDQVLPRDDRAMLIRLDGQGHERWRYMYPEYRMNFCHSVVETQDRGFALAGGVDISATTAILKLDSTGAVQWFSTLGGFSSSGPTDMAQTPDGDYVVLTADAKLVRVSGGGDTLWSREYQPRQAPRGGALRPAADNGLMFCGQKLDSGGQGLRSAWVVKTDSNGFPLWEQSIAAQQSLMLQGIDTTADGGCVVVGLGTTTLNAPSYPFAARLSSSGDTVWTRLFSDVHGGFRKCLFTPDGGMLAVGTLNPDVNTALVLLMKLDSVGDTEWSSTYGAPSVEQGLGICQRSDRTYAISGIQLGDQSMWDVWVAGLEQASVVGQPVSPGVPSDVKLSPNYPNPFNSSTEIQLSLPRTMPVSLKVYDVTGREVGTLVDETRAAGAYRVAFDAGALPSGVYFCRLRSGEAMQTRKMLLLK